MKIIVTGGRDFADREAAFSALMRIHAKTPITLVIHGACHPRHDIQLSGADRWAQEWAMAYEVPYLGVPAKWLQEGCGAGPQRNGRMAALEGVGGVLALPGGDGTEDMSRQAEAAGIRVWRPYG